MPSQIACNLCSYVQVNPRNKEIAVGPHQAPDITQTSLCHQGMHMTEKIVRGHDIVGPQGVDSFRFVDIADLPLNPFLYPRFNCDNVAITKKKCTRCLRASTMSSSESMQQVAIGVYRPKTGKRGRKLVPQPPIKPQIDVDQSFAKNLPRFAICRNKQISMNDIRVPFGVSIIAVKPAWFRNTYKCHFP